MSDYCLYPKQCGIGMDCSECEANHVKMLKDEITRLQSEVERLRARVAQLELAALDAIQAMPGGQAKADLRDAYDEDTPATAWLLRKQAEAVEAWAKDQNLPPDEDLTEVGWHAKRIYERANDYAQRLRQQAAEIEK